eukprot:TRINITY_DN871_c0_g1_i1.p1 TRINITY_DN871_c0_g1~~TRINITY_DN871_c0_g1_i1.p1  ORF type:complete len:220 (+),score=80.37 TRINITY_DN871_c0_g1_i1:97-756(+)
MSLSTSLLIFLIGVIVGLVWNRVGLVLRTLKLRSKLKKEQNPSTAPSSSSSSSSSSSPSSSSDSSSSSSSASSSISSSPSAGSSSSSSAVSSAMNQLFGGSFSRPKLVLCVRTDLQMTKGKIAVQCCHSCLGVCEELLMTNRKLYEQWQEEGQPKIAVKIDGLEEMMEIKKKANSLGLLNYIVMDAGRTQVAPGSKTVIAVGPGPSALVDQVTGHLKLL